MPGQGAARWPQCPPQPPGGGRRSSVQLAGARLPVSPAGAPPLGWFPVQAGRQGAVRTPRSAPVRPQHCAELLDNYSCPLLTSDSHREGAVHSMVGAAAAGVGGRPARGRCPAVSQMRGGWRCRVPALSPLGDFSGRCQRNPPAARGNLLSWARQAGSQPSQASSFLTVFTKLPHPLSPGRKDAQTATWPDVTPARVWGGVWVCVPGGQPFPHFSPWARTRPGSPCFLLGLGRGQPDSLQRPVPRMGGGWQGASGDPRWLAADPRPALAPAPGTPKKRGNLGREGSYPVLPQGSTQVWGLRDWSPPPSPQERTRLSEGITLVQVHPAENRILTAEPGSSSFHCQTGSFLPRSPPTFAGGQLLGTQPTHSPLEGVAQEGVQGRVRGRRSQRGGGATQGRVWPRPLSSLPPTMSHIPSPTPGFALWAAASGRPLGYRTGESRLLCAIGGFPAGPCPGHRTGRGSGRVSGLCASRLEFSSRAASWTERAPDESA